MLLKEIKNLIVRAITSRREFIKSRCRVSFITLLYSITCISLLRVGSMSENNVDVYVELFHSIPNHYVLSYSLISEISPLVLDINILNIVFVIGWVHDSDKVIKERRMYSNQRVLDKSIVKERKRTVKIGSKIGSKLRLGLGLGVNELLRNPVNEKVYQALLKNVERDLMRGVFKQNERNMFKTLKLNINLKKLSMEVCLLKLKEWVVVAVKGVFSAIYSIWIVISMIYPLVCKEITESEELWIELEETEIEVEMEEEDIDLRWYVNKDALNILKTGIIEDTGFGIKEIIVLNLVVFCVKLVLIYWISLYTGSDGGSLGGSTSSVSSSTNVCLLDKLDENYLPGALHGENWSLYTKTGPYSPASLNAFEKVLHDKAIMANEIINQSEIINQGVLVML